MMAERFFAFKQQENQVRPELSNITKIVNTNYGRSVKSCFQVINPTKKYERADMW